MPSNGHAQRTALAIDGGLHDAFHRQVLVARLLRHLRGGQAISHLHQFHLASNHILGALRHR